VEKFEILYSVLKDLDAAGVLDKVILIGSWCQDFYKKELKKSEEIPAARTTDADILVPKKLNLHSEVNIPSILEKHGFVVERHKSGVTKFANPEFKIEFLTNAGAKAEEGPHEFKKLKIVAQELHFMGIPEHYNKKIRFRDLDITIPEPEAFALHKLIVSQRRLKPEKAAKDFEAARALFEYFNGKKKHIKRLNEILKTLPKGWQDRIHHTLEDSGLKISYIQKKQIEDTITMFQVTMTTKDFQTYTYKIGLNNYVIQNNTQEVINNILNEKARSIIKNNVKLHNKEILSTKITRIKKEMSKKKHLN
jgi:hypothetical protein